MYWRVFLSFSYYIYDFLYDTHDLSFLLNEVFSIIDYLSYISYVLCVCVCAYLFFVSLSQSQSLCLWVSLTLSFSLYMCVCVCTCVCVCVYVNSSLCSTSSLSPCVISLSLSPSLFLYFSTSFFIHISLSVSVCLSFFLYPLLRLHSLLSFIKFQPHRSLRNCVVLSLAYDSKKEFGRLAATSIGRLIEPGPHIARPSARFDKNFKTCQMNLNFVFYKSKLDRFTITKTFWAVVIWTFRTQSLNVIYLFKF